MLNQNRSVTSNPSLDEIETGIQLDGSHSHPDDFSVAVLDYAKALGYEISDEDLVHVLIRKVGMQDDLGESYVQNYGHYLSIASDEAVDWLNEKVAGNGFSFFIDDQSLFLHHESETADDDLQHAGRHGL